MALTNVASQAAAIILVESDSSEVWTTVHNDDANRLYVLLGNDSRDGEVTADNYSFYLESGECSVPLPYCGEIRGIWAADGSGKARITRWGR